jgi:hypothetical protein
MELIPWNERTLTFGRGLDELPVLLERLLGTPARLFYLTHHEPRERLVMRRSGSWSIMEHIGHLLLLDERMEARVEDFMARRSELCPINLGDQGHLLDGHRGRDLGDLLEEFRLQRVRLVARISGMDPGALRHMAQHPCRQVTMRPVDMATFLAEHDDHHLVRMRGILHNHRELPSF